MTISRDNPLLATDVYKMGNMEQYKPDTEFVYSYLCSRNKKYFDTTVFFGLHYLLKEYLQQSITHQMADEFIQYRKEILGSESLVVNQRIHALADLGYWPVEIKAVEEGSEIPNGNCLMTITNTVAGFHWCVGFIESLLLKVWYPSSVATLCRKYRKLVDAAFDDTVDESLYFLKGYIVHDFGYRGDASEEGAAISGAAHLLSFKGSDTIVAKKFMAKYYNQTDSTLMASVPASEHSVMCSFGRSGELDAFKNMLSLYPSGIVSIVSDTFNIWDVLTKFVVDLKDQILARDGKVVFRPDSGTPELIICGNPDAPKDSPEYKGCLVLLDEMFGSTVNSKGFKVLNPKVGLIYGDGMYFDRYARTLSRMKELGFAACNLVIGVGGILRSHTRDTLGMAIKATHVVVNGVGFDIEKDPITDQSKKSHTGKIELYKKGSEYQTLMVDEVVSRANNLGDEFEPCLKTTFKNGLVALPSIISLQEFNFVSNDKACFSCGVDG